MKEYILNIITNILNKEFNSKIEKLTVSHTDRIQFRCPYCHEGRTKTKKRGNVYFNKLLFICFRCGYKTSFDKLCKDFNEQIDPDKKLEMIEHLNNVVTYSDYENDFSDAKFDKLIDLSELKRVFKSGITQISDFNPIQNNSGVYKYLINRGITPELHKNIYQGKYWKNENEYEWVIIMINGRADKVLGIQIRNLKEGKKRMFKIYNYENLLEWIKYPNNIDDVSIDELVTYNKLSYFFNILNIDFNQKITIFEGYIDSLFYPNSIGLIGVNTDPKYLENNNLDIQYFFDNDEAGFRKSEQKIKQGYPIFLWNKLFDNIINSKKSNDPFGLLNRIKKVKDLNKLSQLVNNPYKRLNLNNFFSNDEMDIRWIMKSRKKIINTELIDYNKKYKEFDKFN